MIKGKFRGYDLYIDKDYNVTCGSYYWQQQIENGIMVWYSDDTIYGDKELLMIMDKLRRVGAEIEVYHFSDIDDYDIVLTRKKDLCESIRYQDFEVLNTSKY